ncbi:MAG: hypothetical protein HOW73_25280 [Polyangiaceae bacterium]|nr:hypothetical protein [Polyangiaceae bacterium]
MPTKFENLCLSYGAARDRWFEYRGECREFLIRVSKMMVDDWKLPELRYRPLEGKPEEDREYEAGAAIHLDDDGYFHLGVVLTVVDPPENASRQDVVIRICAKKVGSTFHLRFGREDPHAVIPDDDDDAILRALEGLYEQIKDSYDTDLERFVSTTPSRAVEASRRIGFRTAPDLHHMKPST